MVNEALLLIGIDTSFVNEIIMLALMQNPTGHGFSTRKHKNNSVSIRRGNKLKCECVAFAIPVQVLQSVTQTGNLYRS